MPSEKSTLQEHTKSSSLTVEKNGRKKRRKKGHSNPNF